MTTNETQVSTRINALRGHLSFAAMDQAAKHPAKLELRKWLSANGVSSTFAASLSFAKLEEAALAINSEFYSFDLFGVTEALQYTVYDGAEGGHYDWHVDLGGLDCEPRKISLSLQLTAPSQYDGCDLILQAGSGPFGAERARGTLIAFPSYVLHRVTPIQSGLRKSLVIWVAGPPFR